MVEKYKLNLAVALVALLIVIWLIWAKLVWDFAGFLLLTGVTAFIAWTLIKKEKKPAKLLEFFLKSLVVSYVAIGIIWFVWVEITSPWLYANLNFQSLMTMLILIILLSLFPVACSIIIYGIFRIKLKPWEIFLSSWYVSIFVVFTVYQVSTEPASSYSSIAGAVAVVIGLAMLSILIAGILTILYVILKKQK
jgi:hypothetical protein